MADDRLTNTDYVWNQLDYEHDGDPCHDQNGGVDEDQINDQIAVLIRLPVSQHSYDQPWEK